MGSYEENTLLIEDKFFLGLRTIGSWIKITKTQWDLLEKRYQLLQLLKNRLSQLQARPPTEGVSEDPLSCNDDVCTLSKEP